MQGARLPLILSCGDPSGIGPEITLKTWQARRPQQRPFAVMADPEHLAALARHLRLDVPVAACTIEDASGLFAHSLPVIALNGKIKGRAGQPHPDDAALTLQSIRRGVDYVHQGRAHGLVTNPIAKHCLYSAGFEYPGHTEYLGALAQNLWGVPTQAVMMLWCDRLAVVPVTIHVALKEAISMLSPELIITTARIVAHDLRQNFGIMRPRLACAGLNPHAGEMGTMGTEDQDIIAPAVAQLRKEDIDVVGPLPADTMFHAEARKNYDAALCMYHDQALIPIKTLAFDEGVNVTLGLPFIRTSPDHGTAFDIAGQGVARPTSLIHALALADRLRPPHMRGRL
jgi:4-hydroxythreonine-4-phosphate dehydrogenase